MKKKFLLVLLLVVTLVVTGCENNTDNNKDTNTESNATNDSIKDATTDVEESKVLTCTRNVTVSEGVRMELSYKATYKGDYVELIETEERIISDDATVLETYKTSVESIYSPYKGVEYYNYNVEINGNTLISTTNIDYSKIDTDKLIEVDSANASLIKDGKVKISDVKLMYQKVGATCE